MKGNLILGLLVLGALGYKIYLYVQEMGSMPFAEPEQGRELVVKAVATVDVTSTMNKAEELYSQKSCQGSTISCASLLLDPKKGEGLAGQGTDLFIFFNLSEAKKNLADQRFEALSPEQKEYAFIMEKLFDSRLVGELRYGQKFSSVILASFKIENGKLEFADAYGIGRKDVAGLNADALKFRIDYLFSRGEVEEFKKWIGDRVTKKKL